MRRFGFHQSGRRSRRITMLGLGALAAGTLALPSQAVAKPLASATVTETSPCMLTGSYSWSGVGKPHVTAEFQIIDARGVVVQDVQVADSDRSGTISSPTPAQGTFSTGYFIVGFLINSKGAQFMQVTNPDLITSPTC